MKPIFESNNYKEFTNFWIESQPKKGRGLLGEMAKHLGIHTTLLSHTLRGEKNLTCEQAILLGEFMGLADTENDFFILLVQRERAGNFKLKKKYEIDIQKLRLSSRQISKRIDDKNFQLTEVQQAQFYSSWLYSAVRQMTSIPVHQNISDLSRAFPVSKVDFKSILDFLLETGLCKAIGSNIEIGPTNTHIGVNSPFVFQHHKNWRIKAMEKHNNLAVEDLIYSAPFSISYDDFMLIREEVMGLIQKFLKVADKTNPEKLACLNIDLIFVK